MNVSLTPELERFVRRKIQSGLYNNASEVVRESLRLLKERDALSRTWQQQIERGWLQARAGQLLDGPKAMAEIKHVVKNGKKKGA